jgi:glutathione S-transferase
MYAPVVTRFISYDVSVDDQSHTYGETIMGWAPMKVWVADSHDEPQEIIELDLDF